MFERFTEEARQAVVQAQELARARHHGRIDSVHLLGGVAETPGGAYLLGRLGLEREAIRARLDHHDAPGTLDADALAALGIDLDAIRERVEARFGPGALDRGRGRGRCRRGPRGPRGTAVPFTPESKKTLELALREAVALSDHHIGAEHLVLALARNQALPGIDRGAVLAVLQRRAA